MEDAPPLPAPPEGLAAARAVSALSLGWTTLAATAGIAAGLAAHSLVLIAFAAAGVFDALGSAALVVHFGRALRQGEVSERLERAVLALIACGMVGVALATAARSVAQLAGGDGGGGSLAGTVIAGVSVVVLLALARRKTALGQALPSPALRADAHLSRFGAVLAVVTLVGTAGTEVLGWDWLDPAAALVAAAVLLAVGATVARDAAGLPRSEG